MKCGLCNGNENFEILWENDVAYLAFDNYGVHYAHLLLIPKVHVLNIAKVYPQINDTIKKIIHVMNDYFDSKICIYEHGNITENSTLNLSIDHAHLHFLPVHNTERLLEIFLNDGDAKSVQFSEFYSEVQERPYHLLSINGEMSVFTYNKLPSQVFRKQYAICEGIKEWDWKKSGQAILLMNRNYEDEQKRLKSYLGEKLFDDK